MAERPQESGPEEDRTLKSITNDNLEIQKALLAGVHDLARKWFGDHYDMDVLDSVLATSAAINLTGDPPWLMVIGGSGDTKTETLAATYGVPHTHVVSKISSGAAFLSGTPKKSRIKDSDGGLLRKIGDRGRIILKDFTSTIGLQKDARSDVMDCLREIHDGYLIRRLGSDGGIGLEWKGRVICVAACTTSWDRAYDVTADLGPRFVIIRNRSRDTETLSRTYRKAQGMQALGNSGFEGDMRTELNTAVISLLEGVPVVEPENLDHMTTEEQVCLINATDIATRCRTAVDRSWNGTPETAHAPEAPTRFPKQLYEIFRGALLIGMERENATRLVLRLAADSIPPLRMRVLHDIHTNGESTITDISHRLQHPRKPVERECQSLQMLGVLKQTTSSGSYLYGIHPESEKDSDSLFGGKKPSVCS